MHDYEKMGSFYLGREYDLASSRRLDREVLYDSRDLTTHAVCVGMTGSGKTGLCLALLEEAAIDGIPAIAIDPKGDLGNLALTFSDLQPESFLPWVDHREAARLGMKPEEYAANVAEKWRSGLADWDQPPERIARFRDAVDLAIYTPGSNAGLPLTVMRSFAAPSQSVAQDDEALRERIAACASGLLALLGVGGDPIQSRQHILLSNLLQHAWTQGRDLDIAALIQQIQTPPFNQVGILDVESFYPAKDRLELAMSLNNLLASPTFANWLHGESLDIERLLHTAKGKPRLSIISIAHLTDSERMFFVTILLNEVLAWMRGQAGTSSLRAILYMDEVFGYFPPVANPPSKTPMITLLKQARAYGLGVVLATQNPVDLDYKGLANTGTWFLGRLQTERDKARVIEGLEGASNATGWSLDRGAMERALAGLGNRVFLMNNVHEDGPVIFQTRWALSYLRGPLTRRQIQSLMAPYKSEPTEAVEAGGARGGAPDAVPATAAQRPVLPAEAQEIFQAPSRRPPSGARLVYRPYLLGQAKAHYARASVNLDYWADLTLLATLSVPIGSQPWTDGEFVRLDQRDWEDAPRDGAFFAAAPAELSRGKNYDAWSKQLKDQLYRARPLTLFQAATPKRISRPEESEREFRVRLAQDARELRDLEIARIRSKSIAKVQSLEKRIRAAEDRLQKEQAEADQAERQSYVAIGTSIVDVLVGRKFFSRGNVNRATSSARRLSDSKRQREDVRLASARVGDLQEDLRELENEIQQDIEKLHGEYHPEALEIVEITIPARKSDMDVYRVALFWMPWSISAEGASEPLV